MDQHKARCKAAEIVLDRMKEIRLTRSDPDSPSVAIELKLIECWLRRRRAAKKAKGDAR